MSEGDLDDPVDAARGEVAGGGGGVGLVERDGVRHRLLGHLVQVGTAADRAGDGRSAPGGELGGEGADPAEHPVHEDGRAGDGAVAEDRAVGGGARDVEAGPDLVGNLVGQVDRQ